MEKRKTVGDIKKRFEVLNEINSNSSCSQSSTTLQSSIVKQAVCKQDSKTLDTNNISCNIKRTHAFRCDKTNKKLNNIKTVVNGENNSNESQSHSIRNDIPSSSNLQTPTNGIINLINSLPQDNLKSSVIAKNRKNQTFKQSVGNVNINGDTYAQVKKPNKLKHLPLSKTTPRKSLVHCSDSKTKLHPPLTEVSSFPLPPGPPPKKPPRTFAHNLKYNETNVPNNESPSPSFTNHFICSSIRSKTESQNMLEKLEKVLIKQHQNLTKKPNIEQKEIIKINKKTLKDNKKRLGLCFNTSDESEDNFEPKINHKDFSDTNIYAEVGKHFTGNIDNTIYAQGLHYMSTPIENIKPWKTTMSNNELGSSSSLKSISNNSGSVSSYNSNKMIQNWVNEAYDKILAKNTDASSDSDSVTSIPDDGVPNSKNSTDKTQLTLERKGYLKRVTSQVQPRSVSNAGTTSPGSHMFECLLLVGIDMDNVTKDKVPYLIKKYPRQAEVPYRFEDLVFPDAEEWPPPCLEDTSLLCYTIIITSEDGNHKYGYCKRILPEGTNVCLPLAYCIISTIKNNHFYYKLLEEIECHHGQSEISQHNFINELYNQPFPMPGHFVRVSGEKNGVIEKIDLIRRPLNSKKEEIDLYFVLDTLQTSLFLQALGSLLLERKVILLSHSITTLSCCIEGLLSALGPFQWQYTLISLVPLSKLDLIEAPVPYLIGLVKPYVHSERSLPSFEDISEYSFIIDIDCRKILHRFGDENSIIPSRLTKALKSAIELSISTNATLVEKNMIVSEAVLRLYVELIGTYPDYIYKNHKTNCRKFSRANFIKSAPHKYTQLFLEWFSETAMFNFFIESVLNKNCTTQGRFEQLCFAHCDEKRKLQEKKDKPTKIVKHLGDKFKEYLS